MSPYSRAQLWVLLAITALGGFGVAVGAWRRTHPDLTERIEAFDAERPAGARGEATATSQRLASPGDRLPPAGTGPSGRAESGSDASHAAPPRSARNARGGHRHPPSEHPKASGTSRLAKRQPGEGPLDLNRATVEDLRRLPGVGPSLAQRIVTAREQTGRFDSIDDLKGVAGLGTVKFARLRDLVTVSRSR